MRRKMGMACMAIGAVLVLAALSLFAYNSYEDKKAGEASDALLSGVESAIRENGDLSDYDLDMTVVGIDGYNCIGCLTIPALRLELPVISEWSYANLQAAPCRYTGSAATDDLVIAAHNYREHFGSLSKISPGDEVYFMDMNGKLYSYQVVEVDVLNPIAVEEMTSGEYDLTLFTCTYGGQSRTTVRCDRITE